MRRGYIGPIGDDFPSIFPLLFGLLIFFSSLFMAYSAYQAKDNTVQAMKANIMISRAVRYQVVFDGDYWRQACQLAMAMRGDYKTHVAMWISVEKKGWRGRIFLMPNILKYRSFPAVCPLDKKFWGNSISGQWVPESRAQDVILNITKGRTAITMTYPVIWKSGTNEPAKLVVVTWR